MKRIVSLALAIFLILATSALADMSQVRWAPEQMPFFEEKHDLTICSIRESNSEAWDAKWFYRWASDAMNINFDVIEINRLERDQKLNLLFASDDLPDAFYNCDLTEQEISMYGLREKQLLPLNDLIGQYGPNIEAFMEMEPSIAASFYHVDGNIYMLPCYVGYNTYENYTTLRAWINQRWLQNLGLENPSTLEGFHQVLKAFKEQDANQNGDPDDEIPMSDSLGSLTQLMLNLMGATTRTGSTLSPAIYDGEAMVPADNQAFYRSYLALLHTYYAEGLIDQDVFTLTLAQMQANASADVVGAFVQGAPYVLPVVDYTHWTTIKPMTSEFCDELKWPESNPLIHGRYAVSYKCRDLEAAMRFADWHFTQQGSLYVWFGPHEDSPDTLGEIGGWYYSEETQSVDFNYPDGITQAVDYVMYIGPGVMAHPGLSAVYSAIATYLGHEVVNQAFGKPKYWRALMDAECVPYYSPCYPSIYLDDAASNRILELKTPLEDYIAIMEAKFISGEANLDAFDAYYEELQSMGLGEYAGYYEAAYALYRAKL